MNNLDTKISKELISIVIPARNEEANIDRLERELLAVVNPLDYEFEFIVIDNASTDHTREKVKQICQRDQRWRYIRFSKNFSVEMSISAGYQIANGAAIIVLYSDLQDPPEVIPQFLEKWKQGYDVVYGVRTVRPGDPKWRNLLVKFAYRIIGWFSDTPIPNDTGDFRLITKQVRDALNECQEYNRYLRGLIAWLGFRQVGVVYDRRPRTGGVSNAPFWDTVLFTMRAISIFSVKPLRMFGVIGLILLVLSLVGSLLYSILWVFGYAPPGITTLIVLGFLGIGVNSLGIGVLGEYIGMIYQEVKARPKFIVQESYSIPCDLPSKSNRDHAPDKKIELQPTLNPKAGTLEGQKP